MGYKVHLTETCEDDQPHLVTNVETTAATTADNTMTAVIHTHLAQRNLLPSEHLVDTGSSPLGSSGQQPEAAD